MPRCGLQRGVFVWFGFPRGGRHSSCQLFAHPTVRGFSPQPAHIVVAWRQKGRWAYQNGGVSRCAAADEFPDGVPSAAGGGGAERPACAVCPDAGGQRTGGALGTDFVRARAAVPRAGRVQGRHGAGHHGGSVRLAEQAAAGDGGLLVRGAEHCAGGGGPSRHPAHRHPRGGYGKFDGLPACFAVAAVGTVRGLLRSGRTGPADFHPAGGTYQNRRAGAGALRPARPAARGA